MAQETLSKEYFDWMYSRVCGDNLSYRKLLKRLHETEFTYTMLMDDNRAADGVNVRYQFAYENDYHPAMIAEYIDNRPCSVLEMMVSLTARCEDIMADDKYGDRTTQWFRSMLCSLGLTHMRDNAYDEMYVDRVITRLLTRSYESNGVGGLFTVEHPRRDMRLVEIWYQMCWYLNEVLERR